MKKYYIIKGNDEGEAIESYLINSEDNDLDFHLGCSGDSSRSYDTITEEEAIDFVKEKMKPYTNSKILQYNGEQVPVKYEGLFDYYNQVKKEAEKIKGKSISLDEAESWRLQDLRTMMKDIEVYLEKALAEPSYKRKYTGDGLFACPTDDCREYLEDHWTHCPHCGTKSYIEEHMKKFMKGDKNE